MNKDKTIQIIKALLNKTVSNGATKEEEISAKKKADELTKKYKISNEDLTINSNNNVTHKSKNTDHNYYWDNEDLERKRREYEKKEKEMREEEEREIREEEIKNEKRLKEIKKNQAINQYINIFIFLILLPLLILIFAGVDEFISFISEYFIYMIIGLLFYFIQGIIEKYLRF